MKKTQQCFCQSYYDDNNVLQDCTCGKCEKDSSKDKFCPVCNTNTLQPEVGMGVVCGGCL